MKCPPVINLKEWKERVKQKSKWASSWGVGFWQKAAQTVSAFTHNLQGRDRKLARLQAERRICRGLQKVTAFKKYTGAFWRFWFAVLIVCLQWKMVFVGGRGGLGYKMPLCKRLSSCCFKFLFFFPGIPLFRSFFFTHKLWKSVAELFLREIRLFWSNATNSSKMVSLHSEQYF